jgi:hypothetical protein
MDANSFNLVATDNIVVASYASLTKLAVPTSKSDLAV